MLGNLSGWHLIAILFVILLMFGAPKLPALAKSLGQSMKILRKEVSGDSDATTSAATTPAATTEVQQPAPQKPDAS
ncbi:twin-arginine translocase TatA/TatE family subunit [Leucobacter japonicus]|uniref:twin-arginine translocase TatA/TatE family subunit n=1 Tax=Leucobacter japonicus TaxID=1461259 RepID=UPI0006A7C0A4|nr:twin-arginine translocase TatA/TatE family subunit [Leucobacter japonicus]